MTDQEAGTRRPHAPRLTVAGRWLKVTQARRQQAAYQETAGHVLGGNRSRNSRGQNSIGAWGTHAKDVNIACGNHTKKRPAIVGAAALTSSTV
jgi:hypothetical protein